MPRNLQTKQCSFVYPEHWKREVLSRCLSSSYATALIMVYKIKKKTGLISESSYCIKTRSLGSQTTHYIITITSEQIRAKLFKLCLNFL